MWWWGSVQREWDGIGMLASGETRGSPGGGNLALYQLHLVMAWPMTRMTSPITRR